MPNTITYKQKGRAPIVLNYVHCATRTRVNVPRQVRHQSGVGVLVAVVIQAIGEHLVPEEVGTEGESKQVRT